MDIRSAAVIVIALIVAAILHGGVYEMTTAGAGPAAFGWRLNKITGAIDACNGFSCAPASWPTKKSD